MLMTRWEPLTNVWGELNRFRSEMDRLFDSYRFDRAGWPALAPAYPTVNVWQDGEYVYAEAELPGMELSDLEIYVTGGNQLMITGERKAPAQANGVWHRQERPHGNFSRPLTLPVDVEAERIEAKLVNGVLSITMPKCEQAKPRKITVKAD